jgi:hypothetical protein
VIEEAMSELTHLPTPSRALDASLNSGSSYSTMSQVQPIFHQDRWREYPLSLVRCLLIRALLYQCNKMTCPSCRTLSCYSCRQVITGYDHFGHPPPYTGARDPSKCQLWDAVEKRMYPTYRPNAASPIIHVTFSRRS